MLTDPWFYAVAIPAVIIFGLAKGGFAGVSVLGIPLMALVMSPIRAAASVLPILIVQDAISVVAFRRTWSGRTLAFTLPGAPVGVYLGYALAAFVSVAAVELVVGVSSIGFALWQFAGRRGALVDEPGPVSWWGVVFGMASGFTSQLSHDGGPPFQMYVMPKRLPRDVFIGTSAIFFAAVNWLKVPAYAALGQFTTANLLTAAVLLPLAIASTSAGVILVRRVPVERFYILVYGLLIVVGAKLVLDGVRGI